MLVDRSAPPVSTGLPLALEHEAEIDFRLARMCATLGSRCLSDFTFSNLYLFRHVHAYHYLPGTWPCVAGMTYDGVRHLLPLFDLVSAPRRVLQGMLEEYDCFFPVAGETALALDPASFSVTASPDDADYLYQSRTFRDYRGDLLRKKRQLMRQMLKQSCITAFSLTAERMDDALAVLTGWMKDKEKATGEADDRACREALELHVHFGFDSHIYYADGVPAGFITAQRLNPSTVAMRFAKGRDAHKGIYPYMFHHYSIQAEGMDWINFEQDLGLPNFRQTKRSYLPHFMLDKYRVAIGIAPSYFTQDAQWPAG